MSSITSTPVNISFRDLGVPADLVRVLDERGIAAPFPIQAATVRDALAGRDVCGKAPTGSGKTLAFSLPLALRTTASTPHHPTALVLVPTRELATQVRDTLQPLAERAGRTVATVFGGTSINKDRERLRRGVDILVACPGRLADLVRRGDCRLGEVRLVVLDEADRMADMGFLPEVKRLLDATNAERQVLLFSATLDGDVDTLIQRYQHDPVTHTVEVPEEDRGEVRHLFFAAERPERRDTAAKALRQLSPAIVFTRTKRGADRLAKQLANAGISTAAIHGDRSQGQRERALEQFHAGKVTTLVATDVAARGIHVDDVALVLHYDLPADHKDYVHRSGRTGRAGADGVVLSFVGADDTKTLGLIQREIGLPRGMHASDLGLLTTTEVPTPTIGLPSPGGDGRGSGGSSRPGGRGGSGGGRSNGSRRRGRGGSGRGQGNGGAGNGGASSRAGNGGGQARSGGGTVRGAGGSAAQTSAGTGASTGSSSGGARNSTGGGTRRGGTAAGRGNGSQGRSNGRGGATGSSAGRTAGGARHRSRRSS